MRPNKFSKRCPLPTRMRGPSESRSQWTEAIFPSAESLLARERWLESRPGAAPRSTGPLSRRWSRGRQALPRRRGRRPCRPRGTSRPGDRPAQGRRCRRGANPISKRPAATTSSGDWLLEPRLPTEKTIRGCLINWGWRAQPPAEFKRRGPGSNWPSSATRSTPRASGLCSSSSKKSRHARQLRP